MHQIKWSSKEVFEEKERYEYTMAKDPMVQVCGCSINKAKGEKFIG